MSKGTRIKGMEDMLIPVHLHFLPVGFIPVHRLAEETAQMETNRMIVWQCPSGYAQSGTDTIETTFWRGWPRMNTSRLKCCWDDEVRGEKLSRVNCFVYNAKYY